MASKAPWRRFRDHFWQLLGRFGSRSGLPKTLIPYSTSLKNNVFRVSYFADPSRWCLCSVLERLEASWGSSLEAFGVPFADFDWSLEPELSVFLGSPAMFGVIPRQSYLLGRLRRPFGWSLTTLRGVSRRPYASVSLCKLVCVRVICECGCSCVPVVLSLVC